MSDAAIANLITGVVTITTTVIAFLTLWLKLKYGVKEVGGKIDHNTTITTEISGQLNGKLEKRIEGIVQSHTVPIENLLHDHIKQDEVALAKIDQSLKELKRHK